MDIKITGLEIETMRNALANANKARKHILGKMNDTISKHRDDLSTYAPRIITIKINPSKIGEVIGPGGKMIRSIVEETGAKIDINDDGIVLIASVVAEAGLKAKARVEEITYEPEVGNTFNGIVRRIVASGAIVELTKSSDGYMHISEMAHHRVNRVEDIVKLGDKVDVKVISVEPDGRIRLSRKALLPKPDKDNKE